MRSCRCSSIRSFIRNTVAERPQPRMHCRATPRWFSTSSLASRPCAATSGEPSVPDHAHGHHHRVLSASRRGSACSSVGGEFEPHHHRLVLADRRVAASAVMAVGAATCHRCPPFSSGGADDGDLLHGLLVNASCRWHRQHTKPPYLALQVAAAQRRVRLLPPGQILKFPDFGAMIMQVSPLHRLGAGGVAFWPCPWPWCPGQAYGDLCHGPAARFAGPARRRVHRVRSQPHQHRLRHPQLRARSCCSLPGARRPAFRPTAWPPTSATSRAVARAWTRSTTGRHQPDLHGRRPYSSTRSTKRRRFGGGHARRGPLHPASCAPRSASIWRATSSTRASPA